MEPFTIAAIAGAAWLALKKKQADAQVQGLDNALVVTGATPAARIASIAKLYASVIKSEAARLAIPEAAAAAVISIESGGKGFGSDGKLLIRFEPATFKKYTDKSVSDSHKNQAAEYAAFAQAAGIDEDAAYKSISMGAGQIMGFNAKRIGYPSAKAQFAAFSSSLQAQLIGMFEFIRTDAKLIKAARSGDWTTFAIHYNGSGQKGYDQKLAAATSLYPQNANVA